MFFASVAELADAPGLGPGVLLDVKVRLLSLALYSSSCEWLAKVIRRRVCSADEISYEKQDGWRFPF